MFRALARDLYQRVIVAYRSTLIGLALIVADVVLEWLNAVSLPPWAHYIVGLVAAGLAYYRPKPPPVSANGGISKATP